MIENAITLKVDQPRERVFDFLTDLPNEPSWNPDCSSVEMLSPEPVRKGSTYRGHFRGMGQVMVELTAHDRPQRFATRERSRMATGDFAFVLTPYGEQTQVDLRMEAAAARAHAAAPAHDAPEDRAVPRRPSRPHPGGPRLS